MYRRVGQRVRLPWWTHAPKRIGNDSLNIGISSPDGDSQSLT